MYVLLGDSLSVGSFPFLHERRPDGVLFAEVGRSIGWMESQVEGVIDAHPDVVLVMGGANDLPGADAATVLKRLKNLAGLLIDAGAPNVVVATLPPEKTVNGPKVVELNQGLRAWRAPARIRVADVGGSVSEDDLGPDGLHPGTNGYRAIGAAWANVLEGKDVGSGRGGSVVVAAALAIAGVAFLRRR